MKVQVITSEKLLWSPASPTTALALVALADAFMACTSLILFLIANTSQPVSNSDSSSRFEVGPAWTQRFRQIRWTIHTQFTECKQTDKVKDLPWLTSRKFLEEGGVQVRTQLAYLFPDNLHRSKNWRAPRPTSSELQVPPGDVSHKCANLKAGVYIISIVEFSAIYGMVAVKHTFGLQENGRGAAETIFLESKSVFYSYHPIYGRKLDYGNDIHPCLYDNMYNNNAFKSKRILVC